MSYKISDRYTEKWYPLSIFYFLQAHDHIFGFVIMNDWSGKSYFCLTYYEIFY